MNKYLKFLMIMIITFAVTINVNAASGKKYNLGDYVYYDPVEGSKCNYKNYWTINNQNTNCYRFLVIQNSASTSSTVLVMLDHNAKITSFSDVSSSLKTINDDWKKVSSVRLIEENEVQSILKLKSKPNITTSSVSPISPFYPFQDNSYYLSENTLKNYAGFWTNDQYNETYAYSVTQSGNNAITEKTKTRGIRPVITIKKENVGDDKEIKTISPTSYAKYHYLGSFKKPGSSTAYKYRQIQGFTMVGSKPYIYTSNNSNKEYGAIIGYSEAATDSNKTYYYGKMGHGNTMTYNGTSVYLAGGGYIWKFDPNNSLSSGPLSKINMSSTSTIGVTPGGIAYDSIDKIFFAKVGSKIFAVNGEFKTYKDIIIAPRMETGQGLEYHNGYVYNVNFEIGKGDSDYQLYSYGPAYSAIIYAYNAKYNADGTKSPNYGRLAARYKVNSGIGELEEISFSNDTLYLGFAAQHYENKKYTTSSNPDSQRLPYQVHKVSASTLEIAPSYKVTYKDGNTVITSVEDIKSVSGWTLSSDKKKLTKKTSTSSESVKVCDRYSNCSTAELKKLDKITFSEITKEYTGKAQTASGATATSNSKITYTYYSDSACKTKSSAPTNVGTYSVKATSTGNDDYVSNSKCVTFTITKKKDTVTLTAKKQEYNGLPIEANVATSLSKSKITYTYYSDSTCNTRLDSIPVNAGKYYVVATTAGNSDYSSGKSSCTAHTITKKNDVVSLDDTSKIYDGEEVDITTAQAESKTAITYTYYSDISCMTKMSSKPINIGKYSVKATSNGNTNYLTNSTCAKIYISSALDQITLSPKTAVYTGNKITANEASTLSNTSITYTYYSDTSCKTKLSEAPINAGTYSVKAVSQGNNNYASTSICVAHTITKKNDTITLNNQSIKYTGQNITINNAQAESKGEITYSYYSDTSCTIPIAQGPLNVGNYSVKATTAGNNNYNQSSKCATLSVSKGDDIITITPRTSKYTGQPVLANTASAKSGTSITYKYFSDTSCMNEISSAPTEIGEYSVKAISAGNETYASAEKCVKHTITESWKDTINFEDMRVTYTGKSPEINKATSESNSTITYEIFNQSGCVLNNKIDNIPINTGNYSIKATSAGNDVYVGTSKCISLTIEKGLPTITAIDKDIPYDGLNHTLDVPSIKISKDKDITVPYKENYYSDDTCTKKLDLGGVTSPIDVGTYYVKVITEENENLYSASSKCQKLRITKIASLLTIPDNLVLNESKIKELNYTYIGDGSLECISSDNDVATCTAENNILTVYSVNEGNAEINIKSTSSENYNDIVSNTLNVQVTTQNILDATGPVISISPSTEPEYTAAKEIKVTIKDLDSGIKSDQILYYGWSKSSEDSPEYIGNTRTTNVYGATTTSVTIPQSSSSNLSGTYYLWIASSIEDTMNNDNEVFVSQEFKFSSKAPDVDAKIIKNKKKTKATIKVSSVSKITTKEYSLDGISFTKLDKEQYLLDNANIERFYIKVEDELGNKDTLEIPVEEEYKVEIKNYVIDVENDNYDNIKVDYSKDTLLKYRIYMAVPDKDYLIDKYTKLDLSSTINNKVRIDSENIKVLDSSETDVSNLFNIKVDNNKLEIKAKDTEDDNLYANTYVISYQARLTDDYRAGLDSTDFTSATTVDLKDYKLTSEARIEFESEQLENIPNTRSSINLAQTIISSLLIILGITFSVMIAKKEKMDNC